MEELAYGLSEDEILEVYLKFSILDNTTLVNLVRLLEVIKNKVIAEQELDSRLTYLNSSRKKIKPTLDIISLHTGESIRFRYKEGWAPSVKIKKNGDLEIGVNYKIGLTAAILTAVAAGYQYYLSARNSQLDIDTKQIDKEIKANERELRELELRNALEERRDKLEDEVLNKKHDPDEVERHYRELNEISQKIVRLTTPPEETRNAVANYVDYIDRNDSIKFLRINNVVLKEEKK